MDARSLLLFSLTIALFASFLPVAAAQQAPADLYKIQFYGDGEPGFIDRVPGTATASLTFQDLSRDDPSVLAPGSPRLGEFAHNVAFTTTPITDARGWILRDLGPLVTYAGSPPVNLELSVLATSPEAPYLRVAVTAVMTSTYGPTLNQTVEVVFVASGIPAVQAYSSGPQLRLSPRDIAQATFEVENVGLYPRSIDFKVVRNPCAAGVGAPGSIALEPGERREVAFSVQAPSDGFYYQSANCALTVEAQAAPKTVGGGHILQSPPVTAQVFVTVDGVYVAPESVFWTLAAALAIFVLVLIVRRAKARYDERVLQKPLPPWEIPVEKLYLRELRKKDPRAWYVVRHYLMVEEHKSALLWFKAYRDATKGSRKKERLILKQEEQYEAWKAKWAKRIAKPLAEADRFEAKLQRKLDRKARKATRKDKRRWRKATRKLKAKHADRTKKAAEKHAKAVAKARKKGLPMPPPLVASAPELPPEPQPRRYVLAEHRWAKKAARFRRRRVREQGNLEVKFEKQDAKYLRKLRAKVRRIARKLDDPDFVNEHPLLRGDAGQA